MEAKAWTVDEMIDRWAQWLKDARIADLRDPVYHWQWSWMRQHLHATDMAMEDEGIPAETRERVLRTLIYGMPSEADAILRVEAMARQVEYLSRMPMASPKDLG